MGVLNIVHAHAHGWAFDTARKVRTSFALGETVSDDDLDRVLDGLGLEWRERDLPGRLTEMVTDGLIVVQKGLSHRERRWALAHATGHHLGHDGDQTSLDLSWRWRQERQADIFAGFLLLSPNLMGRLRSVHELADRADVPLDQALRWCGWLVTTPWRDVS